MYVGAVVAMDAMFSRSDGVDALQEKTDACLSCAGLLGISHSATLNEAWPPRYISKDTEGEDGAGLLEFLLQLPDSWTRSATAAIAYQDAVVDGDQQRIRHVLAAAVLSFDAPEFFLPQTEFLALCALCAKVDEQLLQEVARSPSLDAYRELIEDRIEWYNHLLMLDEMNEAS